MDQNAEPSFSDWVEYCFTLGVIDSKEELNGDDEVEYRRSCYVYNLNTSTLVEYIVRLFDAPEFIAGRYSRDQIASGIQFLFGHDSDYFPTIHEAQLERGARADCMRAVETLYLRLLDRVCCNGRRDLWAEFIESEPLDRAVFMIWDMGGIETFVMSADDRSPLVQTGFGVLESILRSCDTSTCMSSALHGLGHMHNRHPQRCKRIIDAFLASREIPPWLREYAGEAQAGRVL